MSFRSFHQRLKRSPRRRGVVGVLSMMFMVLFGSLAVAMAIASQGNLQTAQTQLRVNRSIGAADTGLALAAARLQEASRFLRIERGVVDAAYAADLWDGSFNAGDGAVLAPNGAPANYGLIDVLRDLHENDLSIAIEPEYTPQPDWLVTNPIVLEATGPQVSIATQITYAPVPGSGAVRAIVTGFAWDWISERWVTRTVQQDYSIRKRVDHAILGPSKIMIGKNVRINGPLGATFTGVENIDGHPLVMKSDFYGLTLALDRAIDDFHDAVIADDTNGDNKLMVHHTIESRSLSALNAEDYNGDATPDAAFQDASRDAAISDYDLFLQHFDQNGDGALVLSDLLKAGTPAAALASEFELDDSLALLIDAAKPDRNGDGVVDFQDLALGYRDGKLDYKDRYAKVNGQIGFRVSRSQWEDMNNGFGGTLDDFQKVVEGPVAPDDSGDRPVVFAMDTSRLPELNESTFDSANSEFAAAADGASFSQQAGLGGPAYELAVNGDGVVTGQTFNPALITVVEPTPYGGGVAVDYYERPVFQDIVFKDVVIPRGLNALFVNCTFAGITRVESFSNNTHPSWQFYGQQDSSLALRYPPPPAESDAQLDNDYFVAGIIQPDEFDVPRLEVSGVPYVNTKPLSNNIRFHNCVFVGSIVADRPSNYTHVRNKIQFTGATKFHDQHPTLPDDPDHNPESADEDLVQQSSLLAPHYSVDIGSNNAPQSQDVNLKGLIIAGVLDVRGNTNVDGALLLTFEPTIADPALQHFGAPVGNPSDFNATIGYFGPDEGDEEGFNLENLADLDGDGVLDIGWDSNGDGFPDEGADASNGVAVPFNGFGRITVNWNPDMAMPDGLIAPITIETIGQTYREGRAVEGVQQ